MTDKRRETGGEKQKMGDERQMPIIYDERQETGGQRQVMGEGKGRREAEADLRGGFFWPI